MKKLSLFLLVLLILILSPACTAAGTPASRPAPTATQKPSEPTALVMPTLTLAPSPIPTAAKTSSSLAGMMPIPAGEFEMGDHQGFVDPQHPSDEIPLHTVHIDAFYMSATETTNQQYADYLNAALSLGTIEIKSGAVYGKNGSEIYFTTRQADEYSQIQWDGRAFVVLNNRGSHPVTSVRWFGAAAYTNWLSQKNGLEPCFDLTTGKCDFTKKSYRLPTEAEWEYAARGGLKSPYMVFPWGNDNDKAKANWPGSGDPYETGPMPWTTPVGFYNGELRQKANFNWPGSQESYQTHNGVNGYGLYDVAGNVWEYVYDWYGRDYYQASPLDNPRGPESGSPMPDGKPYRGMRGGNWYNGDDGHARVANRNPSYFRGPQDPNHPYYHVGFRVALDLHGTTP